jgi:hypothetical protein
MLENPAEFSTLDACMHISQAVAAKLPNLTLKTRPKQLLSSLPLAVVLPGRVL